MKKRLLMTVAAALFANHAGASSGSSPTLEGWEVVDSNEESSSLLQQKSPRPREFLPSPETAKHLQALKDSVGAEPAASATSSPDSEFGDFQSPARHDAPSGSGADTTTPKRQPRRQIVRSKSLDDLTKSVGLVRDDHQRGWRLSGLQSTVLFALGVAVGATIGAPIAWILTQRPSTQRELGDLHSQLDDLGDQFWLYRDQSRPDAHKNFGHLGKRVSALELALQDQATRISAGCAAGLSDLHRATENLANRIDMLDKNGAWQPWPIITDEKKFTNLLYDTVGWDKYQFVVRDFYSLLDKANDHHLSLVLSFNLDTFTFGYILYRDDDKKRKWLIRHKSAQYVNFCWPSK